MKKSIHLNLPALPRAPRLTAAAKRAPLKDNEEQQYKKDALQRIEKLKHECLELGEEYQQVIASEAYNEGVTWLATTVVTAIGAVLAPELAWPVVNQVLAASTVGMWNSGLATATSDAIGTEINNCNRSVKEWEQYIRRLDQGMQRKTMIDYFKKLEGSSWERIQYLQRLKMPLRAQSMKIKAEYQKAYAIAYPGAVFAFNDPINESRGLKSKKQYLAFIQSHAKGLSPRTARRRSR